MILGIAMLYDVVILKFWFVNIYKWWVDIGQNWTGFTTV